ncbi:hypothetical protein DFH06DRAFT_1286378 [Mycena polygramma]|nr:hypothetical protein DFH06DRAFT_1286378 [Mycena polygramma]
MDLKQCNVANVPSYNSFRKTQTRLRKLCGSEPKLYTSSVGNRFFVNDIRETIARDFSNPEVAKHLQFYPEITSGPISEVWQAERWKEYKPSELTPMYSRGLRQFFLEEVAELQNRSLVIPLAWFRRDKVLYANCVDVTACVTGWTIGQDMHSVPALEFWHNYHDLTERIGGNIKWAAGTNAPKMPNPLRELAQGDDLYVVMVPIWADDVSGNKSKQYNKHINMYLANSNLPGQLLQQEYFVRFSTHKKPIPCYNAETKRNCRVMIRVPSLPADNPQQSEEASHMGGNANCGCRRCKAGGPHDETESDAGYHAMHYAGIPRFAAETKQTLEKQIELAMYGIEAPINRLQTETGVKDKVAQHWIDILLQKAREMKANNPGRTAEAIKEELKTWLEEQPGDKVNPLLEIAGLDPNRDTPVEILHTILLGIVKYVWYILHSGGPKRNAIYSYRNGLIGKHFKALMQTMVFHVHDLVSPELFTLVKAVSHLGASLWVHEIDDMPQYISDLSNSTSCRILWEDAVRFGPLIRNATEVFEGYNAIFLNHQAPSRDIAMKFASMDRMKHMLSGDWVLRRSKRPLGVEDHAYIQRHLGWVPPTFLHIHSSTVTELRLFVQENPFTRWRDTQSSSPTMNSTALNSVRWCSAISVTAQIGDVCRKGSWVFARDAEVSGHGWFVGRIREIIVPESCPDGVPGGLVTLDRFLVSEALHPEFGMPVLGRSSIDYQAVMFRISCAPTALRPVMQERQETSQTTKLVAHGDDEHFVINMAGIHNATHTAPQFATGPHSASGSLS